MSENVCFCPQPGGWGNSKPETAFPLGFEGVPLLSSSSQCPLLSPEALWFWITREKAVALSLNAYGALFAHAVLKVITL